jgi:hypothetical protein
LLLTYELRFYLIVVWIAVLHYIQGVNC